MWGLQRYVIGFFSSSDEGLSWSYISLINQAGDVTNHSLTRPNSDDTWRSHFALIKEYGY